MLPLPQQILFVVFAAVTGAFGVRGFLRLYRRIASGRTDPDRRTGNTARRLGYALATMLTQRRTFRKRPWVSFFHSFIFYGFMFYLLVNLVDAVEGFYPLPLRSLGLGGQIYILLADLLSALVLVGVVALVFRRFAMPSRTDFRFNERTLLHPEVKRRYITADSLIVSTFILFHVSSRAIGAGAAVALRSANRFDPFAPFASLLSHLFTPQNAMAWRIFGYWGALGSVLLFLAYFPYSKHLHIFLAPMKYFVRRQEPSGVLPMLALDMEADEPRLGAAKLEDLSWARLLDAYACVQCNRCQDVCPATATGKALSPSALEINKRMELNTLARKQPSFEAGAPSPQPLLSFALSPEAAWACTTCGACVDVCPVGDEPMLDIIDIRREQVLLQGEFPAQLQSAFRGMERNQNPWGISRDKRLDWAEGLAVKTTDENPEPDVLFWVGCAASYDPQSQKTARAFVQLLNHAEVDFAVLGKRECCTGDSARRAGNEMLYQQLAGENVATLNALKPKLIVATCPHCLNSVGKEYRQLGGEYKVMHHTEYLESLVSSGRLVAEAQSTPIAYHDPCYLGRHNGVYDAPRNVLKVLSNAVVELPRNRENSFCCGAGGAQFWKEEEPGAERISSNRLREAERTLAGIAHGSPVSSGAVETPMATPEKVLAVGCPFCKSMLQSTPAEGAEPLVVRDVAELLLESVRRRLPAPEPLSGLAPALTETAAPPRFAAPAATAAGASASPSIAETLPAADPEAAPAAALPKRKTWGAQRSGGQQTPLPLDSVLPQGVQQSTAAGSTLQQSPAPQSAAEQPDPAAQPAVAPLAVDPPARKSWKPKAVSVAASNQSQAQASDLSNKVEPAPEDKPRDESQATPPLADPLPAPAPRKTWNPKTAAAKTIERVEGKPADPAETAALPADAQQLASPAPTALDPALPNTPASVAPTPPSSTARKAWNPKASKPAKPDTGPDPQ